MSQVFFDPKGKRRRRLASVLSFVGLASSVLLTLFVISLLTVPLGVRIPGLTDALKHKHHNLLPILPNAVTSRSAFLANKSKRQLYEFIAQKRKKHPFVSLRSEKSIVAGFYVPWQETGLHSLRANATKLTHLIPAWAELSANGNSIDLHDWDPELTPHNLDVVNICRRNAIRIVPVFSNSNDGKFDTYRVHKLLSSKDNMTAVATQLGKWLTKNRFQGINVDFENLDDNDSQRVPEFLAVLRKTFKSSNLEISADIESAMDDDLIKVIAEDCDFVVLMAYDEHAELTKPGPIASWDWTESLIEHAVKEVPPKKLVLGIGSYAYDWPIGRRAQSLGYQEALNTAEGYRPDDSPSKTIRFDQKSLNPHFDYYDDDDKLHNVWFLDATTAFNQWTFAHESNLRGAAVWAIGMEDPSLWSFLDRKKISQEPNPSALKAINFPYDIEFSGEGEILYVKSYPSEGERTLQVDNDSGLITQSRYDKYPSSYVVQRAGLQKRALALTFDDGPDGQYTPQILDVLKQNHVPATFFVIGQNAEKFPDLVRRMYAEGHEIGSHTFTHPNLSAASDQRVQLELNATQRALQSILGHSTILFRPPYNADAEPVSAEEVRPIILASKLGYITIGEFIDPQDWNLSPEAGSLRPRTGGEIAQRLVELVERMGGNSILLHDGGGDRSQTVAALRIAIPILKNKGYHFVSASALAGLTRDKVMPGLTSKDRALVGVDNLVFSSLFGIEWFLALAFMIAIGLGIARILIVLPLAIIHQREDRFYPGVSHDQPTVSILIAAYNEEKVIVRTIQSVLTSDYPIREIIVVDDGSSDDTAKVVREAFQNDYRVSLLTQTNSGKAAALNHALRAAKGEIIFCIDADTQLAHDAIAKLVRHFDNPEVGAVAGNVKVGNVDNVITTWQSIEYTTSQNLDRRAYAMMNAITVVPGAIGAWRKEAVLQAGGYSSDTLAEDMDLTWRIRQQGWRLETESDAKAFTEAPDTYRAFFKQRFRWAYGTLQCLWKHRRAVGKHGFFGRFALPCLWVFQIVFQALAPLIDLKILWAVGGYILSWATSGIYTKDWRPLPDAAGTLSKIAFLYALFFAIEFVEGFIAFRMEREPTRRLWWLFLQRFVYRQIMYGVIYKSLATALSGVRAGWGKLDRKATVTLPDQ